MSYVFVTLFPGSLYIFLEFVKSLHIIFLNKAAKLRLAVVLIPQCKIHFYFILKVKFRNCKRRLRVLIRNAIFQRNS